MNGSRGNLVPLALPHICTGLTNLCHFGSQKTAVVSKFSENQGRLGGEPRKLRLYSGGTGSRSQQIKIRSDQPLPGFANHHHHPVTPPSISSSLFSSPFTSANRRSHSSRFLHPPPNPEPTNQLNSAQLNPTTLVGTPFCLPSSQIRLQVQGT